MDDQNVCTDGIPDDLMRELLAKSQLRLAISPELSSIYGLKYGCRMWYMPPLATGRSGPSRPGRAASDADARHGIIIGNIWASGGGTAFGTPCAIRRATLTWPQQRRIPVAALRQGGPRCGFHFCRAIRCPKTF